VRASAVTTARAAKCLKLKFPGDVPASPRRVAPMRAIVVIRVMTAAFRLDESDFVRRVEGGLVRNQITTHTATIPIPTTVLPCLQDFVEGHFSGDRQSEWVPENGPVAVGPCIGVRERIPEQVRRDSYENGSDD